MLKPKKKITKREIKQDGLVTTYFEASSWYEQNKKRLNTVFLVVALGAAAGWIYINNQNVANASAITELGKIMKYYDEGRYEIAINGALQENIRGLQQIVDEYGNTEAGELATMYLANCYYALGNYEKALEHFREADVDDNTLQASVLSGIASCHEFKGDHENAGEYFERAATTDDRGVLAAECLHHAAQNYLLAAQKEKAAELLKRLKKDYPLSSYARDADRLLAQTTT